MIISFLVISVKENSEPRPSMLSSAARVSTSGTLVQDTCLRKRHRSDQSKGFSCDSKTADPLSMPTAGKSSETHYQKINEETKQMGNGFCKNLLISLASLSDKGGPIRHHQSPLPPIFARLSTSEVGRAKKDDDWLVRNQGNFLPFSQKGRWHVYVNAIFIYFPVYYKSCQSFEVFDTFLSLQPVALITNLIELCMKAM